MQNKSVHIYTAMPVSQRIQVKAQLRLKVWARQDKMSLKGAVWKIFSLKNIPKFTEIIQSYNNWTKCPFWWCDIYALCCRDIYWS